MTSSHLIIDGHNDLAWAMRSLNGYDLDAYPLDVGQTATATDLVRLRAGGVGGQFWSVFVPAHLGPASVTATIEQIDFVLRMIARYPDDLALALTAADVDAALASGRIASLMGAEGGHSIDSSLAVLRTLHALGVRYLTLTHNDNVPWADSATDEAVLGGLSDFGRDVVREMNRLGMLVDLSHVAPGTMRDALATTTAPVIFSHSSARAVTDHVRNVPDDVLTTLAGNGGVYMVTFVPAFVSTDCLEWDAAVLADMDARGENCRDWTAHMAAAARRAETVPAPVATLAQVADHVEHVRAVAGIEHVGLGGDFDGCDPMPAGLTDVSTYPALLDELRSRAWSDADLTALTHANVLRVLHDAEVTSGGVADLNFYFDPLCPFAWLTSTWVRQVAAQRDYDVDWRFISLRMINEHRDYAADFPPEYEASHQAGLRLLRVAARTRAEHGPAAVGALYEALGARIWDAPPPADDAGEQRGTSAFVDPVLAGIGLPTELSAALDDESLDAVIRAETDEALAQAGKDVGTPIIHFEPPTGVAFFGPVISRLPSDDDAVALWDHVVALAGFPGFAELKRSLREKPQLRGFGVEPGDVGAQEDWHGGSRRQR